MITEEMLKAGSIVQGIAVVITVLAILIGCLAVAFLFASIIHIILMGDSVPNDLPLYFTAIKLI